ncbi:hypothetical protein [Larkinella terrae]|uniref:Bacterial surface antigen (D15) domain-containing protein n=1 Tax=Larkinella terrae TaxID=2025311 RepID=A0A7K0ERI4_9BACT|nr:hypothetical protein [Larkinella terrae]MRS64146.1 hypothetical protein [Larkinella terrae]
MPANYVPETGKTAQFFGLVGTAHFQPRNTGSVVSLRYVLNAEWMYHDFPGIRYEELAALYGIRLNNFLLSAGVSKNHGVDRGKFVRSSDPGSLLDGDYYEKITYKDVGLPLEAQFIFPFQGFSFRLAAFGNINDGHSYGGFNFSICLGRMN